MSNSRTGYNDGRNETNLPELRDGNHAGEPESIVASNLEQPARPSVAGSPQDTTKSRTGTTQADTTITETWYEIQYRHYNDDPDAWYSSGTTADTVESILQKLAVKQHPAFIYRVARKTLTTEGITL